MDGRQENGQLVLRRQESCWVRIPMKTKKDKIELKREIKPIYTKAILTQKCNKYIIE